MCPNDAIACVFESSFMNFLVVVFVVIPVSTIVVVGALWLVLGLLGIFFETPRYLFVEMFKGVVGNFKPFWRK